MKAASELKLRESAALVDSILERRHKGVRDFTVLVPEELIRQQQQTKNVLSQVLIFIAAISLLVGGIGIMNIMLATVTQRTREIGIRRALGATRNDILAQFLVESLTLSIIGGLLGIAIGAGTDVAIESADIVLVRSNPQDVLNVVKLSQATYGKMVQNLAWATGYNVVAIPLAAGVLYQAGVLLSPAAGAVLMSLSTVIVAINARLLGRVRARLVTRSET